jgi:glutathione synthase/RimK-type ligase-like ATP-grasp enzyme
MAEDPAPIGIISYPSHEVFGRVATRLRDRGCAVTFLDPDREHPPEHLDELGILVNKKIRWESLHALEYAHRNGIPTWNGFVPTVVFTNRLSQLAAFEAVGFDVPETLVEEPAGDHVGKGILAIDNEPVLNGSGDFYQPLLETDGVDRKYYAVDDGSTVHTTALKVRSKLTEDGGFVGEATVREDVQEKIVRLMRFTGARALGVDVIEVGERPVAVDANPAGSFRHTGFEATIADSILDAGES